MPIARGVCMGLMLAVTTGCAARTTTGGASTVGRAPARGRVTDTIFYVSARDRGGGRNERRMADSLEFGLAIHLRREVADVMTDNLDIALVDSVALTQTEFAERLRAATHDEARGSAAPRSTGALRIADGIALLHVHGYSTSLGECWHNVSESHVRSRSTAPWIAFCWPSNGRGVALPRRGALLDRAYREDSVAAIASAPALVRSIDFVLDVVPAERLLLIGHSMGSQLMSSALIDSTSLRARLQSDPLRAIVFASADMETSQFTDRVVPAIRPLTSRLVAYISGRDRMLTLSRRRSGTSRVGLRRQVPLVHPQLESIDVTDALVAENWLQGVFGTHHALRRASAVLYDLVHIIGDNWTADCRAAIGTASRSTEGVWRLLQMRPELAAPDAKCERTPVRMR